MGNNFHPNIFPTSIPPTLPPKKKHIESMQCHQTISHQIKYNLTLLSLLSKNKTNRTIVSFRRYCRSFHFLSPLGFPVTALEISLFQVSEKNIQSVRRFKLEKLSNLVIILELFFKFRVNLIWY